MTPSAVRAWISALGGRRFLLSVGAGIVSSVLVWFTKITSSDYVLVTSATVSAFIIGRSWQSTKPVEKQE